MLLPLLLRLMSCSYNILSPAAERVRVSEGERHPQDGGRREREGRRGEPSYTFNCSFHGGVKDEEREGKISPEGEKAAGKETACSRWNGFLKGNSATEIEIAPRIGH